MAEGVVCSLRHRPSDVRDGAHSSLSVHLVADASTGAGQAERVKWSARRQLVQ